MTLSMTCEQLETILPHLLDDETAAASMTPAARLHLEVCGACGSLFQDLQDIRAQAARLPALVPSRNLWNGVASRIETPIVPLVGGMTARRPRRQISWRAAGIAASVLILVNAGITYELLRRGGEGSLGQVTASPVGVDATPIPAPTAMRTSVETERMTAPAAARITRPAAAPAFVLATNEPQGPDGPRQQEQQPGRRREAAKVVYDREINRLRAIVDSGRHKLDPATAAILDRNLRIIDTAIDQCTEALTRDSSSSFLLEALNNAYQTKVKLLRIAAAAASRE
jgi:hypothetical protein